MLSAIKLDQALYLCLTNLGSSTVTSVWHLNKTSKCWLGHAQSWMVRCTKDRPLTSSNSTCHTPYWTNISCLYLPALKIHSKYPFSSRSICCCLRSFRKARRFSTLSRSLANSLQREKNEKVHHTRSGKTCSFSFIFESNFTKTESSSKKKPQHTTHQRPTSYHFDSTGSRMFVTEAPAIFEFLKRSALPSWLSSEFSQA